MNTNEKKEITIRIAKEEDAEELLVIYAPYIEHTVITYEYDVPQPDVLLRIFREALVFQSFR